MTILYIILIVAMLAGIIYMVQDGATFWSDVEKVAKSKTTKKYFTEFNKNKTK